ncbi:hypothetical protein N788_05110 [Arenimonas donghaensis DSM 18148 = HO3-R19]|uniref:Uncharacterized protein n=1 Tax=Arenimonas donghaensis DSM 18148 = HO3-R19 TaxID=1121014 RepID=A0A087MHB8_9GAMM|nr:hypothetical protein N788_05110 [Arenimonas donghaensis DSM 18148 = HO3-R19]
MVQHGKIPAAIAIEVARYDDVRSFVGEMCPRNKPYLGSCQGRYRQGGEEAEERGSAHCARLCHRDRDFTFRLRQMRLFLFDGPKAALGRLPAWPTA